MFSKATTPPHKATHKATKPLLHLHRDTSDTCCPWRGQSEGRERRLRIAGCRQCTFGTPPTLRSPRSNRHRFCKEKHTLNGWVDSTVFPLLVTLLAVIAYIRNVNAFRYVEYFWSEQVIVQHAHTKIRKKFCAFGKILCKPLVDPLKKY